MSKASMSKEAKKAYIKSHLKALRLSKTIKMLSWLSLLSFVFLSTENIGIKNAKLFEGDMVLNTVQRLAAMKGLDVDKATGNARGSILNKQWPGGVMIYAVDPQIGKEK